MQQTQTVSEPHRGPALRRGKQLPPINTTLESKPASKLQRLQRPRPIETVIYENPAGQNPRDADAPHLQRRLSKGGLRALFTRSKSTNDVKANTHMVDTIQEGDIPKIPSVKAATASVKSQTSKRTSEALERHPSIPTPTAAPNFQTQTLASKNKAKSVTKGNEEPSRLLRNWSPPPLFQAYPQSVKHSHLAAPTASLDTILKTDKSRRTSGENDVASDCPPKLDLDESADSDAQGAKHSAMKPKSRKGGLPQPEWTSKIYVLATSGFLLQYAGDGNFDRLPEKILQLGKTSAAFASDVIPGRRWVLQILQAASEDGVTITSKSIFSKFVFRGDSKRSVSSFLLVLDSPEEMNSWLVAVRKEIEAAGGRKYRPNVGVRKTTDEIVQQLQEKPSRRYLVKRDPNEHSNPRSMHLPSIDASYQENGDAETGPWRDAETSRMSKWLTLTSRHSIDAPSTTHTSMSADQILLDRLRGSMRSSYASTDGKAHITSSEASPVPSPVTANFFPKANESRQSNGTVHAMSADAIRRRSLQMLAPVVNERQKSLDFQAVSKQPRPRSINSCSTLRSASPATPNFSAPSFSKRYSQGGFAPQLPTPPVSAGRCSQKSPSPPHPDNRCERPESTIGPLPVPTHVIPKSSRSRTCLSAEMLSQPPVSSSPPSTVDRLPALNKTMTPSDRPVPRQVSPPLSKEDHPPALTKTVSPTNRPMSIPKPPSSGENCLPPSTNTAPPSTRPTSTPPNPSSTTDRHPPLTNTISPSDRHVARRVSSLEPSNITSPPPRHTPAPHPPPTSALPALPIAEFFTRRSSTPSAGSTSMLSTQNASTPSTYPTSTSSIGSTTTPASCTTSTPSTHPTSTPSTHPTITSSITPRKLRRPASTQVRSDSLTGLRSISSQARLHSSYVAFQQQRGKEAEVMAEKTVPVVKVVAATPEVRGGEWGNLKG